MSPALEETIERGGELIEELIIVDDEDEEVKGSTKPINEEAVPERCPTTRLSSPDSTTTTS